VLLIMWLVCRQLRRNKAVRIIKARHFSSAR
jgi:hypothetical protein